MRSSIVKLMRRVASVLGLVGALGCASPCLAQDVQARLNWRGLMALGRDSSTGPLRSLDNSYLTRAYLLRSTQDIKARIGLRFGAAFHFDGPEADREISYTMTWRLPPGATKPFEEFSKRCRIGRQCYGAWGFDSPSELVPGEWALEVKYRGRLLLDERFQVSVDTESNRPAKSGRSQQFTFLALDEGGRRTILRKEQEPLLVSLPLIRGAVWGSPSTYPLVMVPVSQGATFMLSMDELEAKVSHFAEPAESGPDLHVEPSDARIGRVGTFLQNGMSEGDIAGGGFVALPLEPYRGYFMVYVDRPCRITQQFEGEESRGSMDLLFPTAGLHWVGMTSTKDPDGKSHMDYRLAESVPELVFVTRDLN